MEINHATIFQITKYFLFYKMIVCIGEKVQEFGHLVCPPYFLLLFLLCVYLLTLATSSLKSPLTISLTHPVPVLLYLHSFIHTYIPWMLIEQLLYCISCCSNPCGYIVNKKDKCFLLLHT